MHIINMFTALMRPLNPSVIKASRTSSHKTHFKYARCLAFISVFSLLTACGSGDDGDTQVPVITLNGESTISIPQGLEYLDPVIANDNVDGIIAVSIDGDLDTNILGSYTRTYTATDAAGNQSTATRTITVREFLPFITTWKTDNAGASDDNQITINTTTDDQNYTVDWGDGSQDTAVTGGITHTYSNAGTYTVSIIGNFKNIRFDYKYSGSDNHKLLTIEQWGDIRWSSMERAFYNCQNLVLNASDEPDLSIVSSLASMFAYTYAFNGDVSQWDVSSVTDMSWMFYGASAFNQDIGQWDVSSVTNMNGMLAGDDDNGSVFNQDLNLWDVSSVTNMSEMFYDANVFNQDISQWDVSSVTNMSGMFDSTLTFNQSVGQWDVSSVTDMSYMFTDTKAFNQDISQWDLSSVTNTEAMFRHTDSFNRSLTQWDVSSVTNMRSMFDSARAFNQDIGQWDVSSVIDMRNMFNGTTLSPPNYDALLHGWSSRILQSDVDFHGGNSQYSSTSESARNILINTYNWSITDGGLETPQ